ncbi:FecR family protein [Chitinophaga filiformis]|uniref:FecR protein n=1 Tax=Chitinophaga filiformis TaxID=104663 RepID=A0A1G7SXD9_CHIFI|nr:FecR family protein [Chitinophaga filiformis]SDG27737.1 FecR protein [Chitinophaga filiformis]
MTNEKRVYYLLQQYLDKHISPEEMEELADLLQDGQQAPLVQDTIQQLIEEQPVDNRGDITRWDARIAAIVGIDKEHMPALPAGRVRRIRPWGWVAASVVLLLGISSYLWLTNHRSKDQATISAGSLAQNEIRPGSNKAILTLAGGQQIILDSTVNGLVAQQGGATITKLSNGQLAYQINKGNVTGRVYNTMSTPRGGQYSLLLPDGTGVWLNAASSITYPTVFTGNNREVVISGEVYFEVAKESARPFRVKVNDMVVEVLGTHFNINSYTDESTIKTTLLEGIIKVVQRKMGGETLAVVLKPGQQALAAEQIKVVDHADVDQAMAWKNGLFNFNKLTIQEVLRQLSRWYDVDVVYQGIVTPRKFGGEIGRDLNLSEVLDGLEAAGVHFKVEGKKLIVIP